MSFTSNLSMLSIISSNSSSRTRQAISQFVSASPVADSPPEIAEGAAETAASACGARCDGSGHGTFRWALAVACEAAGQRFAGSHHAVCVCVVAVEAEGACASADGVVGVAVAHAASALEILDHGAEAGAERAGEEGPCDAVACAWDAFDGAEATELRSRCGRGLDL